MKDNICRFRLIIPFIYVTASGEKKEVKMAMELCADGFVRKPYDISEKMQIIDKYVI